MGWGSGSELAETLWNGVRKHIPKTQRERLAKFFIDVFMAEDCDTIQECYLLCKDAGMPEFKSELCDEICYDGDGGQHAEGQCAYHQWWEEVYDS